MIVPNIYSLYNVLIWSCYPTINNCVALTDCLVGQLIYTIDLFIHISYMVVLTLLGIFRKEVESGFFFLIIILIIRF